MANKTVLTISINTDEDNIRFQSNVKPHELAAYLCALMDRDVMFRKTLITACQVYIESSQQVAKTTEKPFAQA